ncbi:hypothetical protein SJAG_05269 [Schizosaccharomyces japonicus yFS275]|uniref:Uncharacterized protein n=1 Tax=Schizosaccharomyces japonicus (strain yFS275 / FY16936) TaxID=402676 RepID=B6K2K9_SCHJY|nr:hypothetical protein SJAG_05269 [Schizosaccharomyces japonicus yFS275]EEB07390.2 hypothetical protein SJAG_05269 [Schizosaccharomyces japonicus yFS275]
MLWIRLCCHEKEETNDCNETARRVSSECGTALARSATQAQVSRSSIEFAWTIHALHQYIQHYSARRFLTPHEQDISLAFILGYHKIFDEPFYSEYRSMSKCEEIETIVTLAIGTYLYKHTHDPLKFWTRLANTMDSIEDENNCTPQQVEFRKQVALARLGHPSFHFLPMHDNHAFQYGWFYFTSSFFGSRSLCWRDHSFAKDVTLEQVDELVDQFKTFVDRAPDFECANWLQAIYITSILPKEHWLYQMDESIDFLDAIEKMKQHLLRHY